MSSAAGGLMPEETTAATFCATLVDEWLRAGVRQAFVAPGSRSTPLALALAQRSEMTLHLFHDERAAAFAGLGHGLRQGRPAVVLCSSGTAGTHFHAAVVEADQSTVPLIVCTADRPPELWQIGAPQTIDQTRLFGTSVRFYAEPGVPEPNEAVWWRSMASRVVLEAEGWSGRPGPVHLNLSFRDPLAGRPGELPAARAAGAPWHLSPPPAAAVAGGIPPLSGRRGVIIAGGSTANPEAVLTLAEGLGWPVLADHRSGCRNERTIAHFDSLLRHQPFAEARRPDVILRFGEPLASKVLSQWITASEAEVISVVPGGRWLDPERASDIVIHDARTDLSLLAGVEGRPMDEGDIWREADGLAGTALEAELADLPDPNEPGVTRSLVAGIPHGSALVVASSMPVRDVEWFAGKRDDIEVYANRGANGIDGVVSTAIGVASSGVPTTCLLGDVALLHDSTALIGLCERPIDLTIVVIDNDGGGIFSFLPQHDILPPDRFEQLFGTPHGTDLAALARAHGLAVGEWSAQADLSPLGVRLLIARTERAANVVHHERLHTAVAVALASNCDL